VVPTNKRHQQHHGDHLEVGTDPDGAPFASPNASLWVDGKRIYEAPGSAMRIVREPSRRVRRPPRPKRKPSTQKC
jgi:hypothetical protein